MRKSLVAIVLFAMLAVSFAACAPQAPAAEPPAAEPPAAEQPAEAQPAAEQPAAEQPAAEELSPVKVVFLLTQPLSPFEEDIWKFINQAKDDGVVSEAKMVEMKSPTEYEQTVRQVSEQGYDMVVSTFFYVHDAINKVAPDFPDTKYVLIYEPNDKEIPNIHGILYDIQEGSYVCGVVAAKMTKTNRVGWFGGDNFPGIVKFLAGYEAGLKAVNPDIQIDATFAGTFIDPDKGHEITLALVEKGDDIVMHAANKTGLGLFSAAKEKGIYAIGVDIDQSPEAPENVICSALTSPGLSIYKDLKDAATGKWQGGITSSWGVDDGAPSVALTDLVPDDVKAAADQAEKDIADGKIVPPQTTEVVQ